MQSRISIPRKTDCQRIFIAVRRWESTYLSEGLFVEIRASVNINIDKRDEKGMEQFLYRAQEYNGEIITALTQAPHAILIENNGNEKKKRKKQGNYKYNVTRVADAANSTEIARGQVVWPVVQPLALPKFCIDQTRPASVGSALAEEEKRAAIPEESGDRYVTRVRYEPACAPGCTRLYARSILSEYL